MNALAYAKIETVKKEYSIKKNQIKQRLKEFAEVLAKDDRQIFEELCFCILTANTSAEMGIRSIAEIRNVLLDGSVDDIRNGLIKSSYRFPNKRAEYIVHAREFLKSSINLKLKDKISSAENKNELRDFFVDNVKGLGYKEASHFLRNVGLKGYGILDKHILNCLHEFGVLETNERPKNRREYFEIEEKMRAFAARQEIDFDELDLLLWSHKTGKILK